MILRVLSGPLPRSAVRLLYVYLDGVFLKIVHKGNGLV
jgi:hypothetical protein